MPCPRHLKALIEGETIKRKDVEHKLQQQEEELKVIRKNRWRHSNGKSRRHLFCLELVSRGKSSGSLRSCSPKRSCAAGAVDIYQCH